MRYRLRHLELDDKMCQQVSLEVFEHVYPRDKICEHLSQHQAWEERERKMNMLVLIYVLLAAALWTRLALPRVQRAAGASLAPVGLAREGDAAHWLGHHLPPAATRPGCFARTLGPVLSAHLHP